MSAAQSGPEEDKIDEIALKACCERRAPTMPGTQSKGSRVVWRTP